MARMMWRANGVRGMGPPRVWLWLGRMDHHDTQCWALDGGDPGFDLTPEMDALDEFMKSRRRRP